MQLATKALLKSVRDLHARSERKARGLMIVEGEKLIAEAAQSGCRIDSAYCTFLMADKLPAGNFPVYRTDPEDMSRISLVDTPPGILALIETPTYVEDIGQYSRIGFFADIADPGNMGTMIRTADWFGLDAVMVTSASVDPYNDKSVRASMGSAFRMPIIEVSDIASGLLACKKAGLYVLGTDVHGSTTGMPKAASFCLVMGNESRGLDRAYDELIDGWYTIPSHGEAESLNVSVSFGIVLSHIIQ